MAESQKLCIQIAYDTEMFQLKLHLCNPTQGPMQGTNLGNPPQSTMSMSHVLLQLYRNAIHSDSVLHQTNMDSEAWGQASA